MLDRNLSKTINLLRFPLTVFVVFIHTHTTHEIVPICAHEYSLLSSVGICNMIEILLKSTATRIAVPVFFVISGFLFFQGLSDWDWRLYKKKLHSRTSTLLLPYICWLTLSYLCIAGIPAIKEFLNGKTIIDSWQVFCNCEINIRDCYIGRFHVGEYVDWFGYEIKDCYNIMIPPFWFVRNLIAVIILSPLFFLFLKKTNIFGVLLLGFINLVHYNYDSTSLFYYSIGALLAINNQNVVTLVSRYKRLVLSATIISLFVCTYYYGTMFGFRFLPVYVFWGVWSSFYISMYLVVKKQIEPNKFLVQSCFFVYAFHYFRFTVHRTSVLTYLCRFVGNHFQGIATVELIQFLIPPITTILICLMLFVTLKRLSPSVSNLLTGNRVGKS